MKMKTVSFKKIYPFVFAIGLSLPHITANAQEKLYKNTFPIGDVKLLESPFRHAMELDMKVVLTYDTDRLMAPYRKEAGLPEKAKSFSNWDGLDGHVGGHYLSALAMLYAETGNAECKQRMEYMVQELKACQDANSLRSPDWAKGYVGGVPNSEGLWPKIKAGDIGLIWKYWVPWYNVHKTYAGLRDAWLYAGNETAKDVFLKFCDWAVDLTATLSDEQMDQMLGNEYGGMNEVFADAYQMTGNEKYMVVAKRFSHKMLLDAMAAKTDNLDNKHANTQVPKVLGFQRIAELSGDKKYADAGLFFWQTVTQNRTLAFGGNSRREFFPSNAACIDFVNDVEGPETCNTYNMLKLTEDLFRIKPLAEYADFYERAVYNHILSTQHPEHGGFVYFTPARPRHYRVYSAPNQAMWCCVGSGMENHARYNAFIYTHQHDSLFLNLFIASELDWKEKGVKLQQETQFPNEEQTKIKITQGKSRFKLMVRYPSWVKEGEMKILVNGKAFNYQSAPSSYVAIDRKWKKGDEVQVILPMHTRLEQMPNVPNYYAMMHGPVLLAAKTGTENLRGLIANDSRWGHIASGQKLPVDKAPIIIEDDITKIADKLVSVTGKPFTFTAPGLKLVNPINIELEPFSQIHDSRYMMYWMVLSNSQYAAYLDSLSKMEAQKLELQKRTIDFVAPGEQQPEADHFIEKNNSNTGNKHDEFWRDARNGGFFSYKMATNSEKNLSLIVRYCGAEQGKRKFDIYIDDQRLVSEDNTGKWTLDKFQEVEYEIPDAIVNGKESVRFKFQAVDGAMSSAVFYVRMARKSSK
jgi:DUF1680 family protein